MNTLEVLDARGHLTLTWDDAKSDEVARARVEVARLKAAGYSFFLVDEEPADEVAAGKGTLVVHRVEEPAGLDDPSQDAPTPPARGRGQRTIAAQPQVGG